MVTVLAIESCILNSENYDVSSLRDTADLPPIDEPIRITDQAYTFASIVIQTYWRGYTCRKTRSSAYGSTQEYYRSMQEPTFRTNHDFEIEIRSNDEMKGEKRIDLEEKHIVEQLIKLSPLDKNVHYPHQRRRKKSRDITNDKREERSIVDLRTNKRTVKKLSCVTIHFNPDIGNNENRPDVKNITLNKRCSSSQSHRIMSNPNISREKKGNDNGESRLHRPKTAGPSCKKATHRNVIPREPSSSLSSTSGSARLENAIKSYLKSRSESTANVHFQEEPSIGSNVTSNIDKSSRFDALLSRLRSLNADEQPTTDDK